MIRGEEDTDSIPTDLVVEILSRLPATSIARFSCVSKQWRSMLLSPYFTELFLTRSSARPRLLFAVQRGGDNGWYFFTSPQPQNPYEKSSSSLVVTADSHMKFIGGDTCLEYCGHASGLICFRGDRWTDKCRVICNPITGQYIRLSLPIGRMENGSVRQNSWRGFLGFDPIEKQFKLLFIGSSNHQVMNYTGEKEDPDIRILTVGAGNDSWRNVIHCPSLNHYPVGEGICINGVLYYIAKQNFNLPSVIVCFDVRSEKFKFIYKACRYAHKLINYKGKLGVINLDTGNRYSTGKPYLRLTMLVLKDVEKTESEWLEYDYEFRQNQRVDDDCYFTIVGVTVSGVTAAGEIVLSIDNPYISEPFYVFYLNLERKTLKSVKIQGFGFGVDYYGKDKYRSVKIFVDHVEDLNFINMKMAFGDATTSISSTERKCKATATSTSAKAHLKQVGRKFESINKFDYLCLSDDD